MDDFPGVVKTKSLTLMSRSVSAIALSEANELFMLSPILNYIYIAGIDNIEKDKYRLFTNPSVTMVEMWYMERIDGILIKQINSTKEEIQFILVVNWRKSGELPIASVIPNDPYAPEHWVFRSKPEDKISAFFLGSFEKDSCATAQIENDHIFIISKGVIFVWKYTDRPEFLVAILIPSQDSRPLFAVKDNYIALTCSSSLAYRFFIVEITEGITDTEEENEPFMPGTKCFELGKNLNIDFGATQEEQSALFLARTLPNKKATIRTIFDFTTPGTLKAMRFLSKNTFIFITSLGSMALTMRSEGSKMHFIPACFTGDFKATSISNNSDFVVLSNDHSIHFIPSPEKCGGEFDIGMIEQLDEIKIPSVRFVTCNQKYCVIASIVSADQESADVRVLEFLDPETVAKAALSSKSLPIRETAIRLMGVATPDFAAGAVAIGRELLAGGQKGSSTRALPFLVTAFNMRGQLSAEHRSSILHEAMSKFTPRDLQRFVERSNFDASEINSDILKIILKLPPSAAARKLIECGKYDVDVSGNEPEAKLHRAIGLSISGDHEKARALFRELDDIELLGKVTYDVIKLISTDLRPQTLIRLGKPELPSAEGWETSEVIAAHSFFNNDADAALESASTSPSGCSTWNFGDWPRVPRLCAWAGTNSQQFAAGCAADGLLKRQPPEAMADIVKAIGFAREKEFGVALMLLPARSALPFLREFARTPDDWAAVLRRAPDEATRRTALHFLGLSSPRADFRETAAKLPEGSEGAALAKELEEIDNDIWRALAVV